MGRACEGVLFHFHLSESSVFFCLHVIICFLGCGVFPFAMGFGSWAFLFGPDIGLEWRFWRGY